MLVLAIVLVLAPAKPTRVEGAFAATPMLVLAGAPAKPSDGAPRAATQTVIASAAEARIEFPELAPTQSCNGAANPIRVFARYLENCSWLC